eukprot:g34487.t1
MSYLRAQLTSAKVVFGGDREGPSSLKTWQKIVASSLNGLRLLDLRGEGLGGRNKVTVAAVLGHSNTSGKVDTISRWANLRTLDICENWLDEESMRAVGELKSL